MRTLQAISDRRDHQKVRRLIPGIVATCALSLTVLATAMSVHAATPRKKRSFAEEALEQYATRARTRRQASWAMIYTPSFRVLYLDGDVDQARRVAQLAERFRSTQLREWTGMSEMPPPWPARCDIYLYSSFRELNAAGGHGKAGSTQVRASKLYHGEILFRRVNLAASDRQLYKSTLPHEVTHLIMGELFGGNVPLWANEGAASVAEHGRKADYYRSTIWRFASQQRIYPIQTLLRMAAYPEPRYRALFYAQSASIVGFLISRRGRPNFARFLYRAQSGNWESAMAEIYQIAGFSDMHRQWMTYLKDPQRRRSNHE